MEVDKSIDEEIEQERKAFESDKIWTARRAFLKQHWNDMPRDRLLCYSQIFINVNMIGCEYSESLMTKIHEMGAGIMDKATKEMSEKEFVRASVGRAHAEQLTKAIAESRKIVKPFVAPPQRYPGVAEKLVQLKRHLEQTEKGTDPLIALNASCSRSNIFWRFIDVNGVSTITIAELPVFRHKFVRKDFDPKVEAARCVIESFINGEEATIVENTIQFGSVVPEECYRNSLYRTLQGTMKSFGKTSTLKDLTAVLDKCSMKITQTATHLQGWSERLDLHTGDLLLLSRVLTKGECVKPKMLLAVDEMCLQICTMLRNGKYTIEMEADGRLVLAKEIDIAKI